jgi:hypothetical protein
VKPEEKKLTNGEQKSLKKLRKLADDMKVIRIANAMLSV